ncbi:hypothetical protein HNP37_000378 [Flavobacterium nitrogenifigens]|uniref:Uncharacterized protein n=2 Tax=Flavobacterium TaxID=237 RepID=A0A7W7ITM4_9FLAO|nr:hypothetical protein [Flavobacterium nitrogenifigens]MBB6385911.1 hypothetical protein [Flavobacterium notoginsengisoli]
MSKNSGIVVAKYLQNFNTYKYEKNVTYSCIGSV